MNDSCKVAYIFSCALVAHCPSFKLMSSDAIVFSSVRGIREYAIHARPPTQELVIGRLVFAGVDIVNGVRVLEFVSFSQDFDPNAMLTYVRSLQNHVRERLILRLIWCNCRWTGFVIGRAYELRDLYGLDVNAYGGVSAFPHGYPIPIGDGV